MNTEMRVMFVPGRAYRVRWGDYWGFLGRPRGLLLLAAVVFLFVSFDPKGMARETGYVPLSCIWTLAILVYVAALRVGALAHGLIMGLRGVYLIPLAGVGAAFLATWALWAGYGFVTGSGFPTADAVLHDVPINFVWAMVFGLLGHDLALTRGAARRPPRADVDDPARDGAAGTGPEAGAGSGADPVPERIEIGGRVLGRDELLYLRADGHHVEVAALSARFTTRARLRDLAGLLPGCQGFQPHRSWWVALRAVADVRVRPEDGQVVLVLTDGSEVNVARTRMAAFRALEEPLNAAMQARRRQNGRGRRLRVPVIHPSAPDRTDRPSGSRSRSR